MEELRKCRHCATSLLAELTTDQQTELFELVPRVTLHRIVTLACSIGRLKDTPRDHMGEEINNKKFKRIISYEEANKRKMPSENKNEGIGNDLSDANVENMSLNTSKKRGRPRKNTQEKDDRKLSNDSVTNEKPKRRRRSKYNRLIQTPIITPPTALISEAGTKKVDNGNSSAKSCSKELLHSSLASSTSSAEVQNDKKCKSTNSIAKQKLHHKKVNSGSNSATSDLKGFRLKATESGSVQSTATSGTAPTPLLDEPKVPSIAPQAVKNSSLQQEASTSKDLRNDKKCMPKSSVSKQISNPKKVSSNHPASSDLKGFRLKATGSGSIQSTATSGSAPTPLLDESKLPSTAPQAVKTPSAKQEASTSKDLRNDKKSKTKNAIDTEILHHKKGHSSHSASSDLKGFRLKPKVLGSVQSTATLGMMPPTPLLDEPKLTSPAPQAIKTPSSKPEANSSSSKDLRNEKKDKTKKTVPNYISHHKKVISQPGTSDLKAIQKTAVCGVEKNTENTDNVSLRLLDEINLPLTEAPRDKKATSTPESASTFNLQDLKSYRIPLTNTPKADPKAKSVEVASDKTPASVDSKKRVHDRKKEEDLIKRAKKIKIKHSEVPSTSSVVCDREMSPRRRNSDAISSAGCTLPEAMDSAVANRVSAEYVVPAEITINDAAIAVSEPDSCRSPHNASTSHQRVDSVEKEQLPDDVFTQYGAVLADGNNNSPAIISVISSQETISPSIYLNVDDSISYAASAAVIGDLPDHFSVPVPEAGLPDLVISDSAEATIIDENRTGEVLLSGYMVPEVVNEVSISTIEETVRPNAIATVAKFKITPCAEPVDARNSAEGIFPSVGNMVPEVSSDVSRSEVEETVRPNVITTVLAPGGKLKITLSAEPVDARKSAEGDLSVGNMVPEVFNDDSRSKIEETVKPNAIATFLALDGKLKITPRAEPVDARNSAKGDLSVGVPEVFNDVSRSEIEETVRPKAIATVRAPDGKLRITTAAELVDATNSAEGDTSVGIDRYTDTPRHPDLTVVAEYISKRPQISELPGQAASTIKAVDDDIQFVSSYTSIKKRKISPLSSGYVDVQFVEYSKKRKISAVSSDDVDVQFVEYCKSRKKRKERKVIDLTGSVDDIPRVCEARSSVIVSVGTDADEVGNEAGPVVLQTLPGTPNDTEKVPMASSPNLINASAVPECLHEDHSTNFACTTIPHTSFETLSEKSSANVVKNANDDFVIELAQLSSETMKLDSRTSILSHPVLAQNNPSVPSTPSNLSELQASDNIAAKQGAQYFSDVSSHTTPPLLKILHVPVSILKLEEDSKCELTDVLPPQENVCSDTGVASHASLNHQVESDNKEKLQQWDVINLSGDEDDDDDDDDDADFDDDDDDGGNNVECCTARRKETQATDKKDIDSATTEQQVSSTSETSVSVSRSTSSSACPYKALDLAANKLVAASSAVGETKPQICDNDLASGTGIRIPQISPTVPSSHVSVRRNHFSNLLLKVINFSIKWSELYDSDKFSNEHDANVLNFEIQVNSSKPEVSELVKYLLNKLGHGRLHKKLFKYCVSALPDRTASRQKEIFIPYMVFYHFFGAWLIFNSVARSPDPQTEDFMRVLQNTVKDCENSCSFYKAEFIKKKDKALRELETYRNENNQHQQCLRGENIVNQQSPVAKVQQIDEQMMGYYPHNQVQMGQIFDQQDLADHQNSITQRQLAVGSMPQPALEENTHSSPAYQRSIKVPDVHVNIPPPPKMHYLFPSLHHLRHQPDNKQCNLQTPASDPLPRYEPAVLLQQRGVCEENNQQLNAFFPPTIPAMLPNQGMTQLQNNQPTTERHATVPPQMQQRRVSDEISPLAATTPLNSFVQAQQTIPSNKRMTQQQNNQPTTAPHTSEPRHKSNLCTQQLMVSEGISRLPATAQINSFVQAQHVIPSNPRMTQQQINQQSAGHRTSEQSYKSNLQAQQCIFSEEISRLPVTAQLEFAAQLNSYVQARRTILLNQRRTQQQNNQLTTASHISQQSDESNLQTQKRVVCEEISQQAQVNSFVRAPPMMLSNQCTTQEQNNQPTVAPLTSPILDVQQQYWISERNMQQAEQNVNVPRTTPATKCQQQEKQPAVQHSLARPPEPACLLQHHLESTNNQQRQLNPIGERSGPFTPSKQPSPRGHFNQIIRPRSLGEMTGQDVVPAVQQGVRRFSNPTLIATDNIESGTSDSRSTRLSEASAKERRSVDLCIGPRSMLTTLVNPSNASPHTVADTALLRGNCPDLLKELEDFGKSFAGEEAVVLNILDEAKCCVCTAKAVLMCECYRACYCAKKCQELHLPTHRRECVIYF